MMPKLADSFHANLEAKTAVSEALKKDAHELRYAVYCKERGYEDHTNFPDRMEMDEFDKEAVQAVVRHKRSKHPVGVVRLVLPNQKIPDRQFPIEMHFGHAFEKSTLKRYDFSRDNIAEVSRFAVSKESLKYLESQFGAEASVGGVKEGTSNPKQLLPHISLGLIAMLFGISHRHGIEYWYAAMEPSLSRLLTRLGIEFTPIGPVMDYHGRRQPMIAKVSDLLENIFYNRRDFYELIEGLGCAGPYQPQFQHAEARYKPALAL